MASNFYVSSVAYNAVAQFAVNHVYSLADIVRQRGAAALQTITSLTSVTTTATATVTGHGFVTGQSVLISGATQTNYNKQTQITVVDANTFTYTITATTSPATGSPVVLDSVAVNTERCFRCTTAGTSSTTTEPTWTLTSNGTTTSGGATFTECTGQAAHQRDNGVTTTWTAPAARWNNLSSTGKNVLAAGDSVYLSSDHAETQSIANTLVGPGTLDSPNLVISALRTGSVPPIAADIASGASITTTGGGLTINVTSYWTGVAFTGATTVAMLTNANMALYLLNCALAVTSNAGNVITFNSSNQYVVWDNTTVQFGLTTQSILANNTGSLEWRNTASAIQGATLPTTLFSSSHQGLVKVHGVDLSALGSGNLVNITSSGAVQFQFSNCKLGSGFVVGTGTGAGPFFPCVELINCDSANTNYNNARAMRGGNLTTDASVTSVGGATDGTTPVSHKLVSNSHVNTLQEQLVSFPISSTFLYDNPSAIGVSCTATVEIISSTTLNINDLWLDLEFPGSSSSPLSSFGTSGLATPLSTVTAITASGAAWNNPPATPVTQKMQVSFTPHAIGPIYGVVKVGKASATAWIDPTLVISIP